VGALLRLAGTALIAARLEPEWTIPAGTEGLSPSFEI
jgi:hypothetical protein